MPISTALPDIRRVDSRYLVRGGLRTPSGRDPWRLVCGVWQVDNGDVDAWLITAYPA